MFVLTVSIAVRQNVRRRMRSVAGETQIYTDISESRRNKIIDGMELFIVRSFSLGEFFRFRANFGSDLDLWQLQRVVPCSHFLPRRERGELNIRKGSALGVLLPIGCLGFFGVFETGVRKRIDAASTRDLNAGLRV